MILSLFFFIASAYAQLVPIELSSHQNPGHINWKKIDTDHYEIIFADDLAADGKRIADILEHIYLPVAKTLKTHHSKISVMLFNQSTQSNGMVTLAPRRSEWYTTPPATPGTFGALDWATLLAMHEIRHVVQFDQAKRGATKIAYVMFGEIGWAIFQNIAIPQWVWEGDAVNTETALSQSGRGRLPEFDLALRTLILKGKRYNYVKAYLRSYKDYIPNHYVLGYHLAAFIKRRYGSDAWERIFRYAARKSYNPFAFDNALIRVTDRNLEENYQDAMDDLEQVWRKQLNQVKISDATLVTKRNNSKWTNYEYPQVDSAGNIIALKSGIGDYPHFVKITSDGKEIKLTTPGLLYDNPFNLGGDKLVWNEMENHLRWGQKDFSVISLYDLKTKQKKVLTKASRLFSPAISHDGKTIAAIEILASSEKSLVLLNASNGKEIKRFKIPQSEQYLTPSWIKNTNELVLIHQTKLGLNLALFSVDSGTLTNVLSAPATKIFTRPFVEEDILYYHSNQTGIDNLFAYNLKTKETFQLTSRPYGAFSPFVKNQVLYFSDYDLSGLAIARTPLTWTSLPKNQEIRDNSVHYYEPLIKQEQGRSIVNSIPTLSHTVTDYSHSKNLAEVHSWMLLPDPLLTNTLNLALISSNKFNTAAGVLGYRYDNNERTNQFYTQLSYAGLWPIFDLGANYGERASSVRIGDTIKAYSWDEKTAKLGFRLPFNFSKEAYSHRLEIGPHLELIKVDDKTRPEAYTVNNGTMKTLNHELSYYRTHTMSMRDINPTWGQVLRGSYRHMPMKTDYRGRLTSVNSLFYFPGFTDHHSLYFNGAIQEQNPHNYRFRSEYVAPRGYDYETFDRFQKVSANYTHPIAFIDYNFGMMIYLKRLRNNFFYDHGVGRMSTGELPVYFNSIGFEPTFDMNLFSLKVPFDLGARFAYLPATRKWIVHPLLLNLAVGF